MVMIPNNQNDDVVPALPHDYDAPFAEPDDEEETVPKSHQVFDNASDLDSQELYDEGSDGAAEVREPNIGNAVMGYDPSKDQRRTQ